MKFVNYNIHDINISNANGTLHFPHWIKLGSKFNNHIVHISVCTGQIIDPELSSLQFVLYAIYTVHYTASTLQLQMRFWKEEYQ